MNTDKSVRGPSPGWWRAWLQAAVLAAATLLVYWPSLRGGLIWDDNLYLTDNPLMHRADGLFRIWFTTESRDYYPVSLSVLWSGVHLWHGAPLGFRLLNLTLHAANGLLLWRLLTKLRLPGAWLAALLWVVHPVNVPSVAWICELKNVLAMTFCLLALPAYWNYRETHRCPAYALALFWFLLALLSKTAVVMLPAVMLGSVWWQRGKLTPRDRLETAPFFALSASLGLVTIWFQNHRALDDVVLSPISWLARCAVAGKAVWFYLAKALVPWRLSMVYERWNVDALSTLDFLPGMLVLVGAGLCWKARESWGRPVLFGVGSFVAMLLPVLGFVPQGFYAYSFVADHWQYFSLPAICAMAVGGGRRLLAGSPRPVVLAAGALATALILVLCQRSWARSRLFQSDEQVWQDTLVKNPNAWVAHYNLANDLARRNLVDPAVEHYQQAIRLNAHLASAHFNLAVVLAGQGQVLAAADQLASACALQPGNADWQNRLGVCLGQAGRFEEAVRHLQESVQLRPESGEAQYNLGIGLSRLGRVAEAIAPYEQALRLMPKDGDVHFALARALAEQSQTNVATVQYREGLRLRPESAQAAVTRSNLIAHGVSAGILDGPLSP